MKYSSILTGACVAALVGGVISSTAARADEKQDLLTLKATVLSLVDALVKQGVLNEAAAKALVKKAEQDAVATGATASPIPASPPDNQKIVRVPYVPEFVKQEIREQVRSELREDVLNDVLTKAKQERWGTPDALPSWVNSVEFHGDLRFRNDTTFYGQGNPTWLSANNSYLNILAVNAAGGASAAGNKAFLNTSKDQNLWKERARIGLTARIADDWTVDFRVATGDETTPVSLNQTLGSSLQRFPIQIDLASLRYDAPSDNGGRPWFTLSFGRMLNPFFTTNLVWDEDINFDGVAATYRYSLVGDGLDDSAGRDRQIATTAGLFPLQQVQFTGMQKWLAAAQATTTWEFESQSKLKLGGAFYDYIHIAGKQNPINGNGVNDSTAPLYLQKGNLLFNIADTSNPTTGANQLFALASDYKLMDLTGSLDLADLAPYHVVLTTDIVKNFGFDKNQIVQRLANSNIVYQPQKNSASQFANRTIGWQFDVTVGWPLISKFGDWQVSAAYRYLQRDAVLDAFTDDDFHRGGTDAKGYRLVAKYGLSKNVWLRTYWSSSTTIDGPPLAIDVLQFDINAKF